MVEKKGKRKGRRKQEKKKQLLYSVLFPFLTFFGPRTHHFPHQ